MVSASAASTASPAAGSPIDAASGPNDTGVPVPVNADKSMPDSVPSGIHMDSGGCGFDFSNIEISNTEYRTPFHGDTHCNTFENDSWNDGFDKTQMQYDQIGVGTDFPYGSEAAALG